MIKKVCLILCTLIFAVSCTTTGFMGLAKESYVKELEEENNQLKEEIETIDDENKELKKEIGTIREDMEKILELAEEIEDLEELTKSVEAQLDELPEETLKKLADIIDDYLAKKRRIPRDESRDSDSETIGSGDGSEEDPSTGDGAE